MKIRLLQRQAAGQDADGGHAGVQLRDGTPLFVDVHPDVSLPPPQSQ